MENARGEEGRRGERHFPHIALAFTFRVKWSRRTDGRERLCIEVNERTCRMVPTETNRRETAPRGTSPRNIRRYLKTLRRVKSNATCLTHPLGNGKIHDSDRRSFVDAEDPLLGRARARTSVI